MRGEGGGFFSGAGPERSQKWSRVKGHASEEGVSPVLGGD